MTELLSLEKVDGIGTTANLLRVTCTSHVTLSGEDRDGSSVDERVTTVAFRSIFYTGVVESLRRTGGSTDLQSHVCGRGRVTGKSTTRNFLDTTLSCEFIDYVGDRECERGVVVELESVSATAVRSCVTGTVGVTGGCLAERGTVD